MALFLVLGLAVFLGLVLELPSFWGLGLDVALFLVLGLQYAFLVLGLFSISAYQQEALCWAVLHKTRDSWQDGLQRHWNSSTGQLPSSGEPHKHLSSDDSHQQV